MTRFPSCRGSALVLLALARAQLAFAQPPNAEPPTPARSNSEAQALATAEGGGTESERGIAVWVTHAESDNLLRIEDGDRGSYNGIGALLNLTSDADRIDTSVNGNIELRGYSDDTIDDEPVGILGALVDFDLVRDRFSWSFADTFSQGQTDPFSAAGPNNRESINVFTTGPQLDLPLGARTSLSLGGDYSSRSYDDSTQLDSDSTVYELGLFRQVAPTARFGLVANSNEVEYDLEGVLPYDIESMSLRYEKTLATGHVRAAIGTNEITVQGQAEDNPLFDFEWRRALATRSTLSIAAGRKFTDTGGAFGGSPGQEPIGGDDGALLSTSPFEQTNLSVSYGLTGTRTVLTVRVGTAEEDYLADAALDNDNASTHATLSRTVTPRLSFGLLADYLERRFDNPTLTDGEEQERTLGGWLNRSLGRNFGVALVLTHYKRRGIQSFDENRYELQFNYSPTDSMSTALGVAGR